MTKYQKIGVSIEGDARFRAEVEAQEALLAINPLEIAITYTWKPDSTDPNTRDLFCESREPTIEEMARLKRLHDHFKEQDLSHVPRLRPDP